MGYIITKSNNETLVLINDGQIDTAITSLTLVGKNVSNFGDAQNENFVHLLENFANSSARLSGSGQPRSPLRGQLWFDTNPAVNRLLVYDGNRWRPLAVSIFDTTTTNTLINATAGPPIPFSGNQPGDFFFNTTNKKLYVVSGTGTELTFIGPESVDGFADTRMASATMFDNLNNRRPVIQMIVDGEVVAVVSSATFQVSTTNSLAGFSRVFRGVTFKNYSSSTRYTTSSTDVLLHGLHEQLDQSYPRRNVNEPINADWSISNGQFLYFGSNSNSSISWNTSTSSLTLSANSLSNLRFAVGNNALTFNGTSLSPASSGYSLGNNSTPFTSIYSSQFSAGSVSAIGEIEGDWSLTAGSLIKPKTDLSNNLGASSNRFDNIFAKTLNAGSSATAGFITGVWNLNAASTIVPVTNLGNDLGQSSKKFNTIYVSTLSGLTSIVGNTAITGNLIPSTNNIYNLGSNDLEWAAVYTSDLHASRAFLGTLQVGNSTMLQTNATTGTFVNIQSNSANISRIIATTGTFVNLVATNGTISILNAPAATLGTAGITNATITTLSATNGSVTNLNSPKATITSATISTGIVSDLQATNAAINTLDGSVIRQNGNRVISSFSLGTTGLTDDSPNDEQVTVGGVLAVKNGGTGNTTFNAGYVRANGANAFTTVATIPWSHISGSPASELPSGATILFAMASPPAGWTKVVDPDYNDRALRIVTGSGGGRSGSVNFTSAFTNQSVTGSVLSTVTNVSLVITNTEDIENEQNQFRVYRYAINDPGHAHQFVGTSIDLRVKYLDLIVATKD